MFLVQAARRASRSTSTRSATTSSRSARSVLVAGDARALKVHVHNERPDEVIAYGLGLGTPDPDQRREPRHQADDVREARATEFAGEDAAGDRPGDRVGTRSPSRPARGRTGPSSTTTAPSRNGAHGPRRSRSTRPRPGDRRRRRRRRPREGVPGLRRRPDRPRRPDGQPEHRRAAPDRPPRPRARGPAPAEQPERPPRRGAGGAGSARTRRLVVVPTRNAAEGIAALLALDPTLDAAANVGPMTDAGRGLQTVQVTEAVRERDDRRQEGQAGPDDRARSRRRARRGRTATATRRCSTAVAAFEPGFELITLYYGADATLAEAEAIAEADRRRRPAAEVEVVHGGQPHYRYLISAE